MVPKIIKGNTSTLYQEGNYLKVGHEVYITHVLPLNYLLG